MHRGITTWFYMVQYRHDVLVGRSWVRNRFGVVKKYQQKFTVFKNLPKMSHNTTFNFGGNWPINIIENTFLPLFFGTLKLKWDIFRVFNHSEKREMSEQFFFRHHFFNWDTSTLWWFEIENQKISTFLWSKMQHHMVHTNLCYLHFLAHCGGYFEETFNKQRLTSVGLR